MSDDSSDEHQHQTKRTGRTSLFGYLSQKLGALSPAPTHTNGNGDAGVSRGGPPQAQSHRITGAYPAASSSDSEGSAKGYRLASHRANGRRASLTGVSRRPGDAAAGAFPEATGRGRSVGGVGTRRSIDDGPSGGPRRDVTDRAAGSPSRRAVNPLGTDDASEHSSEDDSDDESQQRARSAVSGVKDGVGVAVRKMSALNASASERAALYSPVRRVPQGMATRMDGATVSHRDVGALPPRHPKSGPPLRPTVDDRADARRHDRSSVVSGTSSRGGARGRLPVAEGESPPSPSGSRRSQERYEGGAFPVSPPRRQGSQGSAVSGYTGSPRANGASSPLRLVARSLSKSGANGMLDGRASVTRARSVRSDVSSPRNGHGDERHGSRDTREQAEAAATNGRNSSHSSGDKRRSMDRQGVDDTHLDGHAIVDDALYDDFTELSASVVPRTNGHARPSNTSVAREQRQHPQHGLPARAGSHHSAALSSTSNADHSRLGDVRYNEAAAPRRTRGEMTADFKSYHSSETANAPFGDAGSVISRNGRANGVKKAGATRAQKGTNADKQFEPAASDEEKAEKKVTIQDDDGSDKEKSGEDGEGEDDELEEFKFVRKTLPKTAFSHEELRAEFRCLDYSPLVNVRPVDLSEQLRPVKASRKIRMFICITCYNEDGDELRRTLQGIAGNLPKLAKSGLHWSEIALCILIDGREAASQSMMDFLQYEMKLFDPSVLRQVHHGRPVMMHVFERSVELTKHSTQREYHLPLQCMLALKERNGGKLNSHLWFFSGFCVQVNPKYCVLFDVGTVPERKALVKLYHAMEDDPQAGGVCGEITIRGARPWHFLDAAQCFEYKISHVLDKACESVFGYISVLPGAFSAYRWVAIRGEPLCAYFTIEEISAKDLGPFLANMYLAEDRILCFEILARRHRQWLLRYISGAVAETDAPQTLIELIKQRRRWLNGSLFALLYYLYHFPRFMHTSHGVFRKFLFFVQFGFFLTTTILAWFTIGTLFLSFLLIFNQSITYAAFGQDELRMFFAFGYCVLIFLQVMAGMAGKVNSMHTIYFMVAMCYGIMMFFSLLLGVWLVFSNGISLFVGFGFACSIFSYLFAACFHGTLFKSALMFIQYLLLLPVAVNVFPIYSFANLHDISWGTKEGNLQAEQRRAHQGRAERAVKKAQKARDALEQLRMERARAERAASRELIAAQRQAVLTAAGLPPPAGRDAAADPTAAAAAQSVGLNLKGGVGMMKVIDEDNEMAGYVDVTAMRGKDLTLDMSINQAANLQARLGMLTPADVTRRLIRDAKKAAKLHAEAAAREKRLADELALDKVRMQQDFNFFRMRMLSGWVLANALLVVLVAAYDRRPPLGGYAAYTTGTVIYMIGIKLIGSLMYQVIRGVRYTFRQLCGCCYRIDESAHGATRVVCCCRPTNYYFLDDMWEDEHGYEHRYPDDVDAAPSMSPEEQELVASSNGLTLGGYAPDGSLLFYAADGSGPLDCNGAAIDALSVGFILGPNGEILNPDGTAPDVGVVWVDENGNPVSILRDDMGRPVLDAQGNPIPVGPDGQPLPPPVDDVTGLDDHSLHAKGSAGSLSNETVRTVATDVTHAVQAGELPDALLASSSGSDAEDAQPVVEDVDEAARIRGALAKLQQASSKRAGGAGGLMAAARAAMAAKRDAERARAEDAMAAARSVVEPDIGDQESDVSASSAASAARHAAMRSSDDEASVPAPRTALSPRRIRSSDSESEEESVVQIALSSREHELNVDVQPPSASEDVSDDDDGGIAESHKPLSIVGSPRPPAVEISSSAPISAKQHKRSAPPQATSAAAPPPADSVSEDDGDVAVAVSDVASRSQLSSARPASAASNSRPSMPTLRLVSKSSLRGFGQTAGGAPPLSARSTDAPPTLTSPKEEHTHATAPSSRWGRMLSKLPEVLGLADGRSSDSDDDGDVAVGFRNPGTARRSPVNDSHVSITPRGGSRAGGASEQRSGTGPSPAPRSGGLSARLERDEFPMVRVSSSQLSARRPEPAVAATAPADAAIVSIAGSAPPQNVRVGAELVGYTDPLTGRWVRPQPQAAALDEYDLDDTGSSTLPESPPESQLASDSRGDSVAIAVAAAAEPEPPAPTGAAPRTLQRTGSRGADGAAAARERFAQMTAKQMPRPGRASLAPSTADVINLDDLLRDAEAQSDRVIARRAIPVTQTGTSSRSAARTGASSASRAGAKTRLPDVPKRAAPQEKPAAADPAPAATAAAPPPESAKPPSL